MALTDRAGTADGIASLWRRYRDLLAGHRGLTAHDPQSNPVKLLAFDISHELETATVGLDDLIALAKALSDQALEERAGRLAAYLGGRGGAPALAALEATVEASADGAGTPLGFEAFARLWSRPSHGVVLTAHPTFAMSAALRAVLARLTEAGLPEAGLTEAGLTEAGLAEAPDGGTGAAALAELARLPHAPDAPITLALEHRQTQAALGRILDALDEMNAVVLRVARARYPLQWAALTPRLATVASWVGYDIDGRADIGWADSLKLRITEKHAQLERYRARLAALAEPPGGDGPAVAGIAARIDDALVASAEAVEAFANLGEGEAAFAHAANVLAADDPRQLRSLAEVVAEIDHAIAGADTPEAAEALVRLKAEMSACGLGTAHIHLRINASQLHNAAREHVGELADGPLSGRMALARLTELIAETRPVATNLGNLDLEPTTAKRQFMLVAQILKHIDRDTPVRFLIAESEHAVTVLNAIFFARLFGVADKVDISPLFETPDALERGGRLISQLLDNEAYLAYVRGRGRLAIQTGFSDAGRFIGQIPAGLAVERLQVQIARHLADRDITDIEVVVFNTHGESMGRGGHPGGLADRQHYVMTPWARAKYAEAGLALVHESSFQGGDALVYFETRELALATLCGLAVVERAPPPPGLGEDPFYRDVAFTWDLYRALGAYQQELFADADYRAALGVFGTSLLPRTGSRRSRRAGPAAASSDLSRIRAIPHNAILQQLGFLANVKSGLGTAGQIDFDRFVELVRASPRAALLFDYVAAAARVSSATVLSAYGSLFDAGFWIARADAGLEPETAEAALTIAGLVRAQERFAAFSRLGHRLSRDAIHLRAAMDALGRAAPDDEERSELYLAHALRIALIMRLWLLAARLPAFAARGDVTRSSVHELLLAMGVPEALEILREVFPAAELGARHENLAEATTYEPARARGYPDLHERLFEPMAAIHAAVLEISVGLSHRYGAMG